jgi:hypothetical protein
MSAAGLAFPRLVDEGKGYWESLIGECKRQAEAINACASRHGFNADHLIAWAPGSDLHMVKSNCPSTSVKVDISYCSWGPMLDGIITGQEDDDQEFLPEEFTVQIAKDLDGSVVAVYEEGRSFSPREFAAYLMQSFRRCYPCVSLPCDGADGGS